MSDFSVKATMTWVGIVLICFAPQQLRWLAFIITVIPMVAFTYWRQKGQ